jgi:hypothetical protein
MRITLHNGKWAVMAEWLGAIRPVFTSYDVYACIRYRRDNS